MQNLRRWFLKQIGTLDVSSRGLPRWSSNVVVVKNLPVNAGDIRDVGLIPGLGEGNGNPLQYSHLENPMDRGDWQAAVHGVTESWTLLQ